MAWTRQQLITTLNTSKHSELEALKKDTELYDLLTERDEWGDTIGSTIAWKADSHTLKTYLEVLSVCSRDIIHKIFTCKDKDNWTIGHTIARFQNPEAIKHFFTFVNENAPECLQKLLTEKNNNGWTIGHKIARSQNPEAIKHFFAFVKENAPKCLREILTAKLIDGWTILDIIYNRNPQINEWCLEFLAENIPQFLEKLIKINHNVAKHSSNIAKFVYPLLLKNNTNTEWVKFYVGKKLEILALIKKEPVVRREKILKQLLDKKTALNRLFHTSRNILKPGKTKGILKELYIFLTKCSSEKTELKHLSRNEHNTLSENIIAISGNEPVGYFNTFSNVFSTLPTRPALPLYNNLSSSEKIVCKKDSTYTTGDLPKQFTFPSMSSKNPNAMDSRPTKIDSTSSINRTPGLFNQIMNQAPDPGLFKPLPKQQYEVNRPLVLSPIYPSLLE